MKYFTAVFVVFAIVGCEDSAVSGDGSQRATSATNAPGQCEDPRESRYTMQYLDTPEGCPEMPTQPGVIGVERDGCEVTYSFNALTCTATERRECDDVAMITASVKVLSPDVIEGTVGMVLNGKTCDYRIRGDRLATNDAAAGQQ